MTAILGTRGGCVECQKLPYRRMVTAARTLGRVRDVFCPSCAEKLVGEVLKRLSERHRN